jgi:hypothetical protein
MSWNVPQAVTMEYGDRHLTVEAAQAQLEDLFADGQVCHGERPRIVRRGQHWVITVTYFG